jgi:hypothetical protein
MATPNKEDFERIEARLQYLENKIIPELWKHIKQLGDELELTNKITDLHDQQIENLIGNAEQLKKQGLIK